MLTFEEFFKKKKIDIAALQQGEPALFSEFVAHYDRMGEKSFDHTKKYWFNKLRKHYHLAPEIKAEPLRNENKLAEQTITDSLTTPAENSPKQGFTPRFKANMPKPAEPAAAAEEKATDKPTEQAPAKPGFTPRFKPGVTKSAEPASSADNIEEPAAEAPKKPGFTPRFKAGVTKSAEQIPPTGGIDKQPVQESSAVENSADTPAEAPKKPGFTPRFKAGVTKPAQAAPVENTTDNPVQEAAAAENAELPAATPKKPGFTPRFKAGVTKPAAPAEQTPEIPAAQPLQPSQKNDTPPLQEANVPEFDFTGKFVPKSPVGELKPMLGKMDKLTEQADRLAADFKSRFKATHLPKNAARLNPGEQAVEKATEQSAPEVTKNTEADAAKASYKPRFNAKKMPPKE